mmetsp:Transcript_23413/g.32324  ORF Transcript_23413/g.32324 Transcript_23413/m.32324 type:complete len:402 (-) Transcript_23413:103-1308(-)
MAFFDNTFPDQKFSRSTKNINTQVYQSGEETFICLDTNSEELDIVVNSLATSRSSSYGYPSDSSNNSNNLFSLYHLDSHISQSLSHQSRSPIMKKNISGSGIVPNEEKPIPVECVTNKVDNSPNKFNIFEEDHYTTRYTERYNHSNQLEFCSKKISQDECCCQGCHRPPMHGSLYCSHHGETTLVGIQSTLIRTAFVPYTSPQTFESKNPRSCYENKTSVETAISMGRLAEPHYSDTINLNLKRVRNNGKQCSIEFCSKLAVRSTKLCIGHGGGARCHIEGCIKSAQGPTRFCIAHGGGKRCSSINCVKSALGSTKHCIAHGGGSRCAFEGCSKSAPGNTKHCIAHGGGKRCQVGGCSKSSQRSSYFCRAHGGGKSCLVDECNKSAFGNAEYCKIHGYNLK